MNSRFRVGLSVQPHHTSVYTDINVRLLRMKLVFALQCTKCDIFDTRMVI